MAFWRAERPPKQVSWVTAMFVRRRTALTGQGSILQWAIAGTVGIVLGIYTVGVASLPPQWTALLVIAGLCPFVVMIIGNVRRLLLAIIILDIPFQVDVHAAYRYDIAELNALGGLSISVTMVSLVVLYALWLGELLGRMKRQSRPQVWTSTTLSLTAFLAFTTLSMMVARDVTLSLYELFLLSQMFLLYIYVVATVHTRQDVLFIATMLLIGLVLESLVMIGLRFVGHSITVAGILARIDGGTRVGGTLGSPNVAASYLSLFLTLAMSVLLTRLGQSYKLLAMLAFGLGGVALIFTLSRGGWIAFVLAIAILCLLAWRRGWLSLEVPLVAVFGVLLLSLLFQDAILIRIFGDDEGSAHSRLPLMKLAFKIIEDNPVLGVGANNFAIAINQYVTPEFGGEWISVVHNKYLLIWAEIGLGGLVAFLLFLATTIRLGWQCWKFNDRMLSPLALGLTAGIVGQMGHMFVELFNSRPQVQSLWFIAGFITAMSNLGSMTANKSGECTQPRGHE
jgi:putative inorganic carbon (hco3(-)) transporter